MKAAVWYELFTISVDPKVRLAQFKAKQQEPVTVKCVHCRERKRKEYFQCEMTSIYNIVFMYITLLAQQMTAPTPLPNYEGKKDFVYKYVDNV